MLINSKELFGELFDYIELLRLPIIQQYNSTGPFDVVFVEGAITTKEQIKEIKEVRKNTKYLIALGTCATFGGVSATRNLKKKFHKSKSYKDFHFLENIEVSTLDRHVRVDYNLRGCPPTKDEFFYLIKSLYKGIIPLECEDSVCKECREKKNPCLLGKGKDCLGPVTSGGCGALCTSKGIKCYGCRGPVSKPEKIDFLVNLFEKRGLSDKQIAQRFSLFAGTSKRFYKIGKR
jgi:coenzyme F420-reducing hydrogenase gamma subunit